MSLDQVLRMAGFAGHAHLTDGTSELFWSQLLSPSADGHVDYRVRQVGNDRLGRVTCRLRVYVGLQDFRCPALPAMKCNVSAMQ